MFSNPISREFMPIADWDFGMFGNMWSDDVSNNGKHVDCSILAMVKMLILPRRTSNDAGFCYYFRNLGNHLIPTAECMRSLEAFAVNEGLINYSYGIPTLTIVSVAGDVFNILENKPRETELDYPGVEQFFSQQHLSVILLPWESNNHEQHLVVFLNRPHSNYAKAWHAVASLIPTILPQYFEEKPLEDGERRVLTALGGDNPQAFIDELKSFLDAKHYFDDYLVSELTTFSAGRYERQIAIVRRNIDNKKDDIESYCETVRQLYLDLENQEIKLMGLEAKKNQAGADTELIDYIKGNKAVTLKKIDRGLLTYDVDTYLMNYDLDMYNDISKNYGANIYTCLPSDVTCDDARLLYDAIFRDNTVKVRMTSRLTVGIDSRNNIHYSGESTPHSDTRLRNPHLYHHNCFGNNKMAMIECLNLGDYVGAIATTISSVGNLNFGDPYVSSEFAADLFDSDVHCIEFPDGVCLDAYDAIERIKHEQTDNAD